MIIIIIFTSVTVDVTCYGHYCQFSCYISISIQSYLNILMLACRCLPLFKRLLPDAFSLLVRAYVRVFTILHIGFRMSMYVFTLKNVR